MNNLIIGSIYHLTFEQIYPFAKSLFASGYTGKIVLFCLDVSARTKVNLSKMGRYSFIDLKKLPMHVNNSRFFHYREFLQEKNDYDYVLLTDVRDVIFQKNPFSFEKNDSLYVSLEDRTLIGTCPINKKWVIDFYNEEIFSKMQDHRISCAGTIIGKSSRIYRHIDAICKELDKIGEKDKSLLIGAGPDQAAHNIIIRLMPEEPVVYFDNLSGPMMTVGNTYFNDISFIDKVISNQSGVVNIIHQYDRIPELVELFKKFSTRRMIK